MGDILRFTDEELRLGELARYNIAIDQKEDVFCELARLAMLATNMPVAGVSLVDRDHVWLKGRIGVDLECLQREGAFCSYAVESNEDMFVVDDTLLDQRFTNNPLVAGEPHIRYYTAACLISHRGYRLGTLWLMDTRPRQLSDEHRQTLLALAAQVVHILELRYENPLTRLANRSAFVSNLQCALNQQRRSQVCRIVDCARKDASGLCLSEWRNGPCVIGFVRISNISLINSAFGREIGEGLVKQLAGELHKWVGPNNLLGHLEGDHIAFALFEETTDIDAHLNALSELLCRPFGVSGTQLHVSAMVGLSRYPDSGSNASSLLDQAAVAATHPLDAMPVVIRRFADVSNNEAVERLELQKSLADDLREDRLVPYYQPQVDIVTGRVVGFEALARIRHPRFGLLGPDRFIATAEQCGLIREVDLQMLTTVCGDLDRWRRNGHDLVPVAVNFSRTTLMDPGLPRRLLEIAEAHKIDPNLIEVEVTESGFVEQLDAMAKQVRIIRENGFPVSIDDFGTGLSNLGALRNIPFDRLKADRQYVHGASANPHVGGLLRFIKGVADLFEVDVMCEGLEDADDLQWISDIGCHHVQGWYFSRAMAPESMPALLERLSSFYASGRYAVGGPASMAACLQQE
jgi:EAL domain-containing protein (putative c-di-GMP-specific phosphodiesterase class I)/GGDEF domain-containing protein